MGHEKGDGEEEDGNGKEKGIKRGSMGSGAGAGKGKKGRSEEGVEGKECGSRR
jgi:hypothetical protein